MKSSLRTLWAYRHFIVSSIRNEFRARFVGSRFGMAWMLLNPLAQVLVYALILSQVMRSKLPEIESSYAYPIYILSGIVAWTFFSEIVSRTVTVFVDQANLLKKMNFPKLALPLIVAGAATVNFLLLVTVMFLVFALLGHFPIHALIWLPLPTLVTLGLATGLGLSLGVFNVFIRDIGHVMNIILQFWFWLTPIVYTLQIVPERYRWLMEINPMTGIVSSFQEILLYDRSPRLEELGYPGLLALFLIFLGLFLFRRAETEMADVL